MTQAKLDMDKQIRASVSPRGAEYENAHRALVHAMYQAEIYGHASPQAKSAAARYGQLISRGWKCRLVARLTDFAMDGCDGATRERVRQWQRQTFGQSVASRFLTKWAQPGAGSRGQDDFLNPSLTPEAAILWDRHKESLRSAMEALKAELDAGVIKSPSVTARAGSKRSVATDGGQSLSAS